MGREWYAVRVRECLIPPKQGDDGKWISGRYVKKTHIYFVPGTREAAQKYKGSGLIMHVQKVSRNKVSPRGGILPEIGGFLKIGDQLLQDLNEGGTLLEQVEKKKDKRRLRFRNKNFRRGLYADQRT
jgi:hypothetical protein